MKNPFRHFNSSPEVIRLTVMLYTRYPLSLRQVEDILFERGIDICDETVRLWWNRFGQMFAAKIRKRRIHHHSLSRWRWHLGEVFVRIRDIKTLQKFSSAHASIHNHCNLEHHLAPRENFNRNRCAALAEWRRLAA